MKSTAGGRRLKRSVTWSDVLVASGSVNERASTESGILKKASRLRAHKEDPGRPGIRGLSALKIKDVALEGEQSVDMEVLLQKQLRALRMGLDVKDSFQAEIAFRESRGCASQDRSLRVDKFNTLHRATGKSEAQFFKLKEQTCQQEGQHSLEAVTREREVRQFSAHRDKPDRQRTQLVPWVDELGKHGQRLAQDKRVTKVIAFLQKQKATMESSMNVEDLRPPVVKATSCKDHVPARTPDKLSSNGPVSVEQNRMLLRITQRLLQEWAAPPASSKLQQALKDFETTNLRHNQKIMPRSESIRNRIDV